MCGRKYTYITPFRIDKRFGGQLRTEENKDGWTTDWCRRPHRDPPHCDQNAALRGRNFGYEIYHTPTLN